MSRKAMCKSCVNYDKQQNGKVVCIEKGKEIDPESYAPIADGRSCYGREVKPSLTVEQLHEIRSAAGRKGGLKRKKNGRSPTKQLSVRLCDYKVFSEYSQISMRSMAEQFHIVALEILKEHPHLKPPEWID